MNDEAAPPPGPAWVDRVTRALGGVDPTLLASFESQIDRVRDDETAARAIAEQHTRRAIDHIYHDPGSRQKLVRVARRSAKRNSELESGDVLNGAYVAALGALRQFGRGARQQFPIHSSLDGWLQGQIRSVSKQPARRQQPLPPGTADPDDVAHDGLDRIGADSLSTGAAALSEALRDAAVVAPSDRWLSDDIQARQHDNKRVRHEQTVVAVVGQCLGRLAIQLDGLGVEDDRDPIPPPRTVALDAFRAVDPATSRTKVERAIGDVAFAVCAVLDEAGRRHPDAARLADDLRLQWTALQLWGVSGLVVHSAADSQVSEFDTNTPSLRAHARLAWWGGLEIDMNDRIGPGVAPKKSWDETPEPLRRQVVEAVTVHVAGNLAKLEHLDEEQKARTSFLTEPFRLIGFHLIGLVADWRST